MNSKYYICTKFASVSALHLIVSYCNALELGTASCKCIVVEECNAAVLRCGAASALYKGVHCSSAVKCIRALSWQNAMQ